MSYEFPRRAEIDVLEDIAEAMGRNPYPDKIPLADVKNLVAGTFTAVGMSTTVGTFIPFRSRSFNISLWGTFVATIQLERSFDGTNWFPITANGTQLEKFTGAVSEQWSDDESGVQYRLNCTAYTSGTVNYRISQ